MDAGLKLQSIPENRTTQRSSIADRALNLESKRTEMLYSKVWWLQHIGPRPDGHDVMHMNADKHDNGPLT